MLMGDFLTLVQYDLPVKVVLFDNSSLGMVELEMRVSGLPAYGTTNRNPDFAAIARASASRMVLAGGVGRMTRLARSNLRNIPRP
ncbi:hypothetical protein GCM10022245_68820 [Streptomyces mayteni]